MKRSLTWIGLVLGVLLVGGWYAFTEFNDTYILARNQAHTLDVEVLHGVKRLILLWTLMLAGALISAVPAWFFIVAIFFKLHAEDREAQETEQIECDAALRNALQVAQERARAAQMLLEV